MNVAERVEADIARLRPHTRRIVEYREALVELLRALASARTGSARVWALEQAIGGIAEPLRRELVGGLVDAGDDHNRWWTDATEAALSAAAEVAADAQLATLRAAYRAGAQ